MKYTLKQWRGVKGITQAKLSEQSGVSAMKIAMLETITAEDIENMRNVLDLKTTDSIILPSN